MKFREYKIKEFLEDLSSNSPAPGGGSLTPLILALSASLNNMVYSLTIGKKSFESLDSSLKEKMINFEKECNKFIENSLNLMEEDREAFLAFMDVYKIKKGKEREMLLRKSTYKAMEVPLKAAREGVEFYKNIKFAITYGNKNLISDGGVAASLLHSAIESSIINVKVNLNNLRDEEYFSSIDTEIEEIFKTSLTLKNDILKIVNNEIYIK